jgi:Mannosyltransferase (PIG-V)
MIGAAIGMTLNPAAFQKLFFAPTQLPALSGRSLSYYWDLDAYANIALQEVCGAFYPLWGLVIRWIVHPQTVIQAAFGAQMIAIAFFFLSLPFVVWIFQRSLQDQKLAFWVALIYGVSPMAIFRLNGYSEGWFSVLSLGLIWALGCDRKLAMVLLCGFAALMSLSRPVLLQIIFASVLSLATVANSSFLNRDRAIRLTFLTSISAIVGYCFHGWYCLNSKGSFLAPFYAQAPWKKAFGLRLELWFLPKSPFLDLLAVYTPMLITCVAIALLYFQVKRKPLHWFIPRSPLWYIPLAYPPLFIAVHGIANLRKRQKPEISTEGGEFLRTNYIFWFCTYFALAHSLLGIFTQDRLYSIGRHVFAVPFVFIAIGALLRTVPQRIPILIGLAGISALLLIQQWVDYGNHRWLG